MHIYIADSNGNGINLSQLKPGASMKRAKRYTTKEAIESIPEIEDPSQIKDVVFQVGLNDFRKAHSPSEIQEDYLDMQLKYHSHFPNARQHIVALPPLANGHIEVNKMLQKLSKYTGANFVSAKNFCDTTTGKLRGNVMNGIHYNTLGTKILAKDIKKSLYSPANRDSNQLSIISDLAKETSTETNPMTTSPTPTSETTTAEHIFIEEPLD